MADNVKLNHYDRIKPELNINQKYPEGRDKLLSLAESSRTRTPIVNASTPKDSPGKPKMGLKDVRRVGGTNSNISASSGQPPAFNGAQQKIRPVPVYASEQSLPEKVSQALKGFAAMRPTHRQHGAIAADDVVYYSSGSNNSSYDGGANGVNARKISGSKMADSQNNLLKQSLSKSTEKLNNNNLVVQQQSTSSAFKQQQADRPTPNARYSKVKQYSYGVNLEDLRKMYKSMPNCAADDEYDDVAAVASNRQSLISDAIRDNLSDESSYANIDELRRLSLHQSSDDSVMMMMMVQKSSNLTSTSGAGTNGVALLRNSCGSPTDSGYRSVPRELDLDESSSAPPKRTSFESQQNVVSKCSILVDSAPSSHDVCAKDAATRKGAQASKAEETSTTCPSPYSDLSSQSYNSSLHSSGDERAKDQRPAQETPVRPLVKSAKNGVAGSFDTINTNVSLPEDFSLERCPKLVELDRVPWNEKDVVTVLQKGRTKGLVNQIAIDIVPRLTYLLQRPLIRLAKEIQRLSVRFNKCTKHEVHCATKVVLPYVVGESCIKAALQASAMYMMSGDVIKQSKSQRAGLRFSVGKFHRWLCDAQVALCVLDMGSVYLTAVMENLLEEIVLQSMPVQNNEMLTSECLDATMANNVELWGLLQPYAHLICSRTANGVLGLPNSVVIAPFLKHGANKLHEKVKTNGTLVRNLEQCLLATCAGSLSELGELVNRVNSQSGAKGGSNNSIPSALASAKATSPTYTWSKEALQTLFYFMRCSQLEHTDSVHPSLLLTHERPYLVLPPLVEWLRVSQAHCEHRQSSVVDSDDILQAARVLLPGLDYPTRSFGVDDPLHSGARVNPQTWSFRMKQDLALRMLSSGRSELVPQAVQLLGSQNLDTPNEQGLTPLMLAALNGDEAAVHILLDAGSDVNACVPVTPVGQQACPSLIGDLAGWTALNFAVVQKHVTLVQHLLNRNASVELSSMCTETPLQLAAMMGHCDLVNLLFAKGADPYYSTSKCDAGFKQKGCPSAIVLAAAHGHRNIVQILLSRRKGRSEEVLSLEDFLAEGAGASPTGAAALEAKENNVSPAANWISKLSKNQQKTLQEAMYHAAEGAFVDITMDLRNFGIAWNTHIWTQTLGAAQELRRKALVQLLLTDFVKCRLEDLSQEFIDDCLPLLFEIFRRSKNEVTATQISKILNHLYGNDAIPEIRVPATSNAPRIDAKYVNNAELSDVKFLIDGRLFYAHKIVLFNSSERFKQLLQESIVNGDDALEIKDVRYDIFQLVMEFLYNGSLKEQNFSLSQLLQLLSASRQFDLQQLQINCENLITKYLNVESCLEIYRFACTIDAVNLIQSCEGFFLQHLLSVMSSVDGFRKMIYSSSKLTDGRGADLVSGLLSTLTLRLEQRLNSKK